MSPAQARGDSKAARTSEGSSDLERGRQSYEGWAWLDAYESLSRADETAPLGTEDLELLATAAYMLGRDDVWMRGLERAHLLYVDAADTQRGARCAISLGITLALRGEVGGASGWLGRAQRLLERDGRDCAEHGYLLLPVMFEPRGGGRLRAAAATAADAVEIGQRFGDPDLVALAAQAQGYMLIKHGQVTRVSASSTKRWSPSRPVSCRRSRPGSSIAA